ncbi:MAG: hydroxymethylpyrimidine/phosphomethylpyrimidine kinase [Archaeoglobaceae archaeon]
MQPTRSILSIAGFDTSCGAGICADVKTASSLSFYACTSITAVTYQNTCGIQGFKSTSKEELQNQLKAVLGDISVDAVKIGMISNEDTADVIKKNLKGLDMPRVLDPVIKSTTGFEIGSAEFYSRVMDNCTVVTPNVYEAGQLTGDGDGIADVKSAKKTAKELSDGFSVVITGVNGKDVIFDAISDKLHVIGEELKVEKVHGTGCVYSTSLACYLSTGLNLFNACKKARRLTISAARKAVRIGNCLPVINP